MLIPILQKLEPCANPMEDFLRSLNQPVGSKSLAGLAKDAGEAVVVICDQTRPFLDSIACTGLNCTVLTAGSEKSLHHSLNRISASLHLLEELT